MVPVNAETKPTAPTAPPGDTGKTATIQEPESVEAESKKENEEV